MKFVLTKESLDEFFNMAVDAAGQPGWDWFKTKYNMTYHELLKYLVSLQEDSEKCIKFQILNGELRGQILLLDDENKKLKESISKKIILYAEAQGEILTLKEKLEKIDYEIERVLTNVHVPMVDISCEKTIQGLYTKLKEILGGKQ